MKVSVRSVILFLVLVFLLSHMVESDYHVKKIEKENQILKEKVDSLITAIYVDNYYD